MRRSCNSRLQRDTHWFLHTAPQPKRHSKQNTSWSLQEDCGEMWYLHFKGMQFLWRVLTEVVHGMLPRKKGYLKTCATTKHYCTNAALYSHVDVHPIHRPSSYWT